MSVAQTNPAIKEAWGVIKFLSGDERNRALAEAREKARMDLDSWLGDARHEGLQEGLQKGLQEGLQKGLQEGLQKGKFETARNLLQEKVPLGTVSKATGLTLEDVKRLAADLKD
jgi:predicted transposase/invertase (TIGR01784 family)